jgi:hypothetical protein
MNTRIKTVARLIACLLIVGFGITHLALPLWLDFLLALIMLISVRTIPVALGFAAVCAVLCFLVSWTWGDKRIEDVYYREHEKHIDNNGLYTPNVEDEFDMPYGDLYALGRGSFSGNIEAIKEPRHTTFKSDSNGFRSDVELRDADVVLVGDSFIVATGVTQADMPSRALAGLTGKKIANIAFPGNAHDYEDRLARYQDVYRADAQIFVFYFEGNDYSNQGDQVAKQSWAGRFISFYYKLEDRKTQYLRLIYPKDQVFFRLIRRIGNNATHGIETLIRNALGEPLPDEPTGPAVLTKPIAGQEVGFLSIYKERSQTAAVDTYIMTNEQVLPRIKGVFFIPTKFRVYAGMLGENVTGEAIEILKRGYAPKGIPVHDLTPVLTEESQRALADNQFVYWRDDSHWNGRGIAAAMKLVAEQVK